MTPSEESILTNFLLSPATLPSVISLEKFAELFPKKLRSHLQIRTLYRELQHIRAQDVAIVKENIARETRNGEKQKEELRQASANKGVSNFDDKDQMEIDMDVHLFGQPLIKSPEDSHIFDTLIPEMQCAVIALKQEIEANEKDISATYAQLTTTVGELSDLRYGKLNTTPGTDTTVAEDVVNGLNHLEDVCNSRLK